MNKDIRERIEHLSPEKKRLLLQKIKEKKIEKEKELLFEIVPVEDKEYYPLSSTQKRIYWLYQMDPSDTAYNMPGFMMLEGPLDIGKFEFAFHQLIGHNEAFRTSFIIENGEPLQRVHKNTEFSPRYFPSQSPTEFINSSYYKEFNRPFVLSAAPLLRVGLVPLEPERHLLLLNMHHIITDGSSINILVRRFLEIYSGQESTETELRYRDFAVWQNGLLDSGGLRSQEEFWLNQFSGTLPVLDLPTDFQRPSRQSHEGNRVEFRIAESLTQRLKEYARENEASLFMILLAVYNLVLNKYSGQEDIIVGTPIAGRPHSGLQNILGLFIETLALRNRPESGKTLAAFVKEVRRNSLDAFDNQVYPFRELIRRLGAGNDLSRNPLFDAMLILHNTGSPVMETESLKISPYPFEEHVSKLDLNLVAREADDCIDFELQYCTALFKAETAERLARHFVNTIRALLANPALEIRDLDIMDESERVRVLEQFNDSGASTGRDVLLHGLFEEQAARTPHRVALVDGEVHLSYSELDKRSSALAAALVEQGIGPDVAVAMKLEASVEMITGILGILKSGGAYLPIAPDTPDDRVDYIMSDSNAPVLLTRPDIARMMMGDRVPPIHRTQPSGGLCYVIYTSGTTGKPKGVLVEHRNVTAYLDAFFNRFDFHESHVLLQLASYTFDVFTEEMYPILLRGGKLVIPPLYEHGDVDSLVQSIARYSVNIIDCTPLLLNEFNRRVEQGSPDSPFRSLEIVISGGDVLKPGYVDRLAQIARVYNTYGPTESTVCATYHHHDPATTAGGESIPIGKPIHGYRVYILDRFDNPVPVGVPGELCVAGPGITRGYLNRPDLTHEKFIQHSTFNIQHSKLYKTGDRARWLSDGSIRFMGRVDHQVKIRGFRIEPGGIEARLLCHESVRETVVMARDNQYGDKYLCAYVVSGTPGILPETEPLKEYLGRFLPSYMIPAYIIPLEQMPVTTSGKVDRLALPEPAEILQTGVEYVAPSNAREESIVQVWQTVLGMEKIGVLDNFFDLGGDSILVNRAIAAMREAMKIDVPVRIFFQSPTVRELANSLGDSEEEIPAVTRAPRDQPIPLSFPQERLWFLQQLDKDSGAYHVPRSIRIRGKININRFERTFSEIIRRHEILRTVFPTIDGRPFQQIKEAYEVKIPLVDLTVFHEEERQAELSRLIMKAGQEPFDFINGPLLKLKLFKIQEEEHVLLSTEHHLIHDGWTQGVLLKEFITIYRAYSEGKPHPLPELPVQYADFATWQRTHIQGDRLEKLLDYWRTKLSGMPDVMALPFDHPRPPAIRSRGVVRRYRISESLTRQLKNLGKQRDVTLYMIMLAAFKTLLLRYMNVTEADLCIGTGIANRRLKEIEGMLGMVINTLPLRTRISGDMTFAQCLEEVKSTCLDAYEHEDTPFEKIVEAVQPKRSLSYTPIFQVLFSFMDTPSELLRLPDLELQAEAAHNNSSKFDINIVVLPPLELEGTGGEINVEWEYSTDLFNDDTMDRMIGHYTRLLEQIQAQPEQGLFEFSLMDGEERKKILYTWNNTGIRYPDDKTVHQLFHQQARLCPSQIAVRFEERHLTYSKLEAQSHALASVLLEKGLTPGEPVGIMMPRSIESVIGVLGILKAGGVYLPIDPKYPEERKNLLLRDSGMRILLTPDDFRSLDNAGDIQLPSRCSSDPAYIIYTSGTTGIPKGVMVEHRSVVRLVKNTDFIQWQPRDRFMQTSPLEFDLSTFELWGPLLNGVTLFVVSRDTILSTEHFKAAVHRDEISVMWVTSALFNQLVDTDMEIFQGLRVLLAGGDKLSPNHINRLREKYPSIQLVNGYGPTENATFSTTHHIDREYPDDIPIGKPIANSTAYIVDPYGQPVPIGVMGELWVGGDGLARGYLNRPELSAEKFTSHFTFDIQHSILYKTGDLARWQPDGFIRFMGRIDQQVKIRGFRIEPGEIENLIARHESVKDTAVIVRENNLGEKYLAAYIVWNPGAETKSPDSVSVLKKYLGNHFPGYMIPSFFVQLPQMPLTPNGKLDRRALPVPGGTSLDSDEFVPPSNEAEDRMAVIWSGLLSVPADSISVTRNFFEMGGHSLKATIMVSRIHQEFDVKILLSDVFKHPTIRKMVAHLSNSGMKIHASIEPVEKREYYPLSPAQNRIYVLQQVEPSSVVYNMPWIIPLQLEIEKTALENIFLQLIHRHESLRTSFHIMDGQTIQRVHDHVDFRLESLSFSYDPYDLSGLSDLYKSFIKPFDLDAPPLLRTGLIDDKNSGRRFLLVDMHHIISDGVSHRVLEREFEALYRGEELPPLRLQYKDYALWQGRDEIRELLEQHGRWWTAVFEEDIPVLQLPTDFPRPAVQSFEGDNQPFTLDAAALDGMKALAASEDCTLFMVMLALFNVLLFKLSGQSDIVVGTPSAGREHADFQSIIGMFVNTLALRNKFSGETPFVSFLETVKQGSLEALEHQEYPFGQLVERLGGMINRDAGRNPLFDVMFSLNNWREEIGESRSTLPTLKTGIAKFDLTLFVLEAADRLECRFEYCTELFAGETIQRFIGYFKNIIGQVIREPHRPLFQTEIMTESEKRQVSMDFNRYDTPYPVDMTLPRLFSLAVEKYPQNIAVVDRDMREFTFKEIDERANLLASRLMEKGTGKDRLVGLSVERSAEMITGILGILKTGAGYVPLNPKAPESRNRYILEDAGVSLVLTGEEIARLSDHANVGSAYAEFETPGIDPSVWAYVIYTSGTTGQPKGVPISHSNLMPLLHWGYDKFGISPEDRALQNLSYYFDWSVWEIFFVLTSGARLYLAPDEILLDPGASIDFILENQISVLHVTPTQYSYFLKAGRKLETLRYLFIGAEKLAYDIVRRSFQSVNPECRVFNMYGPTEATIISAALEIDRDFEEKYRRLSSIPIGYAAGNSAHYILDKHMNPVPVNVVGELYIAGDGLSGGYLNNPELTAQKFIPPDSKFIIQNSKLYKTGDLARWRQDGCIQFMGRIDQQVKIRGFRIEPGEIETFISRHESVKDIAVIVRENNMGEKYLAAYIVWNSEAGKKFPDSVSVLKKYMGNHFPGYMIPSFFVQLPQMPLTPNGKLDRRALPVPGGTSHGSDEFVPPSNYYEDRMAVIWSDLLSAPADSISVTRSFFEMGGHSLKATILVSRIHQEFHVKIPLSAVFNTLTIRKMVAHLRNSGMKIHDAVEPMEKRDYYPLSPAQNRIYVLQQVEPSSVVYNMPWIIPLHLEIEKMALENIFLQLILRHESLRTSFHIMDGRTIQRVHDHVDFRLESLSFSYDPYGPYDQYDLYKSFIKPFGLDAPPLLRAALMDDKDSGRRFLLVDMHHIISDGVSHRVLEREFEALYRGEELPPLRLQYKDYALWQDRDEIRERLEQQGRWWTAVFEENIPVLQLPTDFPRPTVQSFEGDTQPFTLDAAALGGMKALAASRDCTLFMVMLALFNVLLFKLSGQSDIVVGTPSAGRGHTDFQSIIGMFVNTLAIRNKFSGETPFVSFLSEVKQGSLEALEHQEYPFEQLVERLGGMINRDAGRNPLFDVMFSLNNWRGEIDESRSTLPTLKTGIAKFDLTLFALEAADRLECRFEYCTELFAGETIQRFISYFENIIRQVIREPHRPLFQIEIMTEHEKQRVLEDFNDTSTVYPSGSTIHELFGRQAARTPGHIALVGEKQVTYGELDSRSGILAANLTGMGVVPGVLVSITVERSVEMVIGLLGILKAGGAYLPIDPGQPGERTRFMQMDANAPVKLMTDDIIRLSSGALDTLTGKGEGRVNDSPVNVAYVLYTSGSTGRPKGVMVEHRNVVRLVKDTRYFDFDTPGRILQTGALEFDASTFEIWGALLNGWSLHLEPKETILEPGGLKDVIARQGITAIWMTSPLYNRMADIDIGIFAPLKHLLVGGDVLSPPHINRLRTHCPDVRIINGYGPTENTTFSTTHLIREEYTENIPIGTPISNSTAYVVDPYNQPVPVGIPGELLVGGDGVARGYLNNPELTAEKFIHLKFDIHNSKLYRTGDLARWKPDGNIEFLGRIDQQVKIRGFRIEPEEIETQIIKHPDIINAVVPVLETTAGEKYLCAYMVVRAGLHPVPAGFDARIKEYLSQSLPEFMIPSHFVVLEKIPLTPNGKIDRSALPRPDFSAHQEIIPPSNPVEAGMVELWAETLGLESRFIGANSNFFQLGGHSLKATFLAAKVHQAMGVKLPLKEIFSNPTVKGLARYIRTMNKEISRERYAAIQPVKEKYVYVLSSAQKRLFVLQQMEEDSVAYNMPLIIPLEASIDRSRLEEILQRLIRRHQSLRTSFHMMDGEPYQRIHHHAEFSLEDLSFLYDIYDLSALYKFFIKPFDLGGAPLLRAGLLKDKAGRRFLIIDMHHIISDGISLQLLKNEFLSMYSGQEPGPLPIRYVDYAEWQQSPAFRELSERQERWWLEQFADAPPVLDLPLDYMRPKVQSFEGASHRWVLDENVTSRLRALAKQQDVTLFMLMGAMFYTFLYRLSGQEDIILGTPVSGRGHTDLHSIIGMFVNTLALRNFPSGEKTFTGFLREVKQQNLEAFENQDYPFELLVDELSGSIPRDTGRNALFDVMLSVINLEQTTDPGTGEEVPQIESRVARFDLTLTVLERHRVLELDLEYCTRLFKPGTITRYCEYFNRIISGFLDDPGLQLSRVDILPPDEREAILVDFNGNTVSYPDGKTLHRLFEEQVERTPDAVAVYDPVSGCLTYDGLNRQAGLVAGYLMEKGVRQGDIVGLMLERSVGMMAGILGILKSGCAYLPINPEYPQERIDYIISDSNAACLLTIDDIVHGGASLQAAASNPAPAQATGSCYVIYTSGTTGKPKGVMVEHRNVVAYLYSFFDEFDIRSTDAVIQLTSFTFDAFVEEVFPLLVRGGRVIIPGPEVVKDVQVMAAEVLRHHVTVIDCSPLLLSAFDFMTAGGVGDATVENPLRYVRIFISGGDVLKDEYVRNLARTGSVYNTYGPTESTVCATYFKYGGGDEAVGDVPIGKPIANYQVYIFDSHLQPVPIGVPGEICVAGPGVTRGYLNRGGLTAEKFIYTPHGRVYKTGDLGCWMPDGNIRFLGRVDLQVKIRGFRIEPGEIENHLIKNPGIKDALVMVRERPDKEKYLCAYIISNPDNSHLPKDSSEMEANLVRFLSQSLPAYMIPAHFIPLEKIPLTPNGKLDYRALPLPGKETAAGIIAPVDETEIRLAVIWSEVLRIPVDKIGVDSDFFQLGGHSLKATFVTANIHKELGVKITLGEFFQYTRLQSLARFIETRKSGASIDHYRLSTRDQAVELTESRSSVSDELDVDFEF